MDSGIKRRHIHKHLILLLAILAVWITGDFILDRPHYGTGYHRKLQNHLMQKFRQIDRYYESIKETDWQLDFQIPSDRGIIMLAYNNDSLIYWSDNNITFASFISQDTEHKRFEFISNGWYAVKEYQSDSIRAYGLYLIKSEYPYENDFLQNDFHEDLKLPKSTELLTKSTPGAFSILDWEGIYLFSVRFNEDELRYAALEKYFSPTLFFLFFIIILLLTGKLLETFTKGRIKNRALLFLVFIFILLRWMQLRYHMPGDLYELELFGPVPFAYSLMLPSLGDVLINTMLLLFLGYKFNRDFEFTGRVYKENNRPNYLVISGFLIGLTAVFTYTHYVLSNLIIHSTINFELFNIANLNIYTILSLLVMAMHFTLLLLICDKLIKLCKDTCNFQSLIGIFLFVSALLMLISLIIPYSFDIWSYLAFLIMFTIVAVIHYRKITLYNYAQLVLMVIFFSVYAVFFITHYSKKKTGDNMKVLAEKLAEQHDPVAEYLLEDIYDRIMEDKTLFRYLYNRNIPYEEINNHLQNNYFNGFWSKYSMYTKDCLPEETYEIPPTQLTYNCYDYFDNLIEDGGIQLGNTNFYYLNIFIDGGIHYLGRIPYKDPGSDNEGVLYLRLDSKLIAEELGYPELLLDKKFQEAELFEGYSYAKYYRNQLLARSGDFQYSLNLNTYDLDDTQTGRLNRNANQLSNRQTDSLMVNIYEFNEIKFDGYAHHVYRFPDENVIIISKPVINFFDKLISFSYIFLFFYLLIIISIGIQYISENRVSMAFNFKNKIRLAIISILLLSLIFVGGGTIYLSIEQYKNKQYDNLSEKIQSVYLELYNVLAYRNELPPDWSGFGFDNLNQLLINLSDVFYSDINLYDPEGNMLATSRAEIFNQGIIGQKMDPVSYNEMVLERQSEYIHTESIGDLRFLSAYIPFVNTENNLLAFLNLPYFTKENELRNETTNLFVAVINIYVLLILLTFTLTIFISNQIVSPLRLIQQKFGEVKLGKKNEEIFYKGRDEIAGLVDEYNRMVKELAKSVELLSRSERESAWREMAKQIAHEIKNPLTPMKLSVQHLQRSWKDNKDNFDDYLEKFTRNLIEQIDNLSFIASEFSNFAKMPKANYTNINLVEVIRSTLSLFPNTENMDIVFLQGMDEVEVFADKEQLSRVFINLIKNAIQAVPENQTGKIEINMELIGNKVLISISDNGKGIPVEIQNKLFTPSFTTKSSGMGLGLSITKNIIESFRGNITFKTEVNEGTTFFVELPVYQEIS